MTPDQLRTHRELEYLRVAGRTRSRYRRKLPRARWLALQRRLEIARRKLEQAR
jgi:hypothetical protein